MIQRELREQQAEDAKSINQLMAIRALMDFRTLHRVSSDA